MTVFSQSKENLNEKLELIPNLNTEDSLIRNTIQANILLKTSDYNSLINNSGNKQILGMKHIIKEEE
jgi:hypothetical protein